MSIRTVHDPWLHGTVLLLVAVGLLMVGSASLYVGLLYWKEPSTLFFRQAAYAGIGLAALCLGMNLPLGKLKECRWVAAGFFVSLVLLIGVLAMPPSWGARRWYDLGFIKFQPSELVKLYAVVFVAHRLAHRDVPVSDLWRFTVPCFSVVGILAALILAGRDLGGAVVLVTVSGAMAFVAGLRWRHGLSLVTIGLATAIGAILLTGYRIDRIIDYVLYIFGLRPPGYQLKQSLIALGSGGWTGVGFANGKQQAFFLPASHTDFIFSIIGEEWGLLGTLTVLAAFMLIFWRGTRVAQFSAPSFESHLAFGMTFLIVLQGLINMGVCTGLLPTKGLTLPFVSYGGSSLVCSMLAMGLLLNASHRCRFRQ